MSFDAIHQRRLRSGIVVFLSFAVFLSLAMADEEGSSIKQLRAEAERGDVMAQYELGMCYLTGGGLPPLQVPQDEKLAFKWMSKSAALGFGDAMLQVAIFYSDGVGVPADLAKAESLLQALIAGGETPGVPKGMGLGVRKDVLEDAADELKEVQKLRAAAGAGAPKGADPTSEPGAGASITFDDVKTLLEAGSSTEEILPLLKKRGYSGSVDAASLIALRKIGADATLLLALKNGVK